MAHEILVQARDGPHPLTTGGHAPSPSPSLGCLHGWETRETSGRRAGTDSVRARARTHWHERSKIQNQKLDSRISIRFGAPDSIVTTKPRVRGKRRWK